MTMIKYKTTDGMVQMMRQIRDEINIEIKDMTFAEEREYLDKLLNKKSTKQSSGKSDKREPSASKINS